MVSMVLNVGNINKLADRIEQCKDVHYEDHKPSTEEPSFTMYSPFYRCGAPACMLGHFATRTDGGQPSAIMLGIALGIDTHQAYELTAPQHWGYAHYEVTDSDELGYITVKHAVVVLRNLAETGEIDWTLGSRRRTERIWEGRE